MMKNILKVLGCLAIIIVCLLIALKTVTVLQYELNIGCALVGVGVVIASGVYSCFSKV